MNKTIIAAMVGGIATIIAAFIGLYAGKSAEQKNIQNEINEAMGDMVNIIGDGNEVTINDIKDLVEDYQNLKSQNASLVKQNTKYFNDLSVANDKIESYEKQTDSTVQELEQMIGEMPNIQFKTLGLSIEGNVIPINSTDSVAIINNRTYYADDFINSIISSSIVNSNANMSVQDDTMYIGKIIKEKSYLLDQWEFDYSDVQAYDNITDSYGKMHTNSLVFKSSSGCYIIYNLNREFSFMKFNLFIRDNADNNKIGTLTIKADDELVYTSPELTKTTEKVEAVDVPIKNCSLLTIEYNATGYNHCIMSNIEIYN